MRIFFMLLSLLLALNARVINFNGLNWGSGGDKAPTNIDTIYTKDGNITENRAVDVGQNYLTIKGSNYHGLDVISTDNRGGIIRLKDNGNKYLWLYSVGGSLMMWSDTSNKSFFIYSPQTDKTALTNVKLNKLYDKNNFYPTDNEDWDLIPTPQGVEWQPKMTTVPETWHYVGQNGEPQFKNGVTNYNNSWGHLRFIKLDNGLIALDGLIKNVEKGKVIFTLPAGYRPTRLNMYPAMRGATSAGRIDIKTNGDVISKSAKTGYLSLSGISFVAK